MCTVLYSGVHPGLIFVRKIVSQNFVRSVFFFSKCLSSAFYYFQIARWIGRMHRYYLHCNLQVVIGHVILGLTIRTLMFDCFVEPPGLTVVPSAEVRFIVQ